MNAIRGDHTGRRLFVARFFHEGNSFGPLIADRAAFGRHEWFRASEAIERAAGSNHELAALPPFARHHPEWRLAVSRCAAAIPSGPIDDAVFEAFLAEVLADLDSALAAGGVDAVYLSLHGAAMTVSRPGPNWTWWRRSAPACRGSRLPRPSTCMRTCIRALASC